MPLVFSNFDSALASDPPGQVLINTRVLVVPNTVAENDLRVTTLQVETTVPMGSTPNQIASAVRTATLAAVSAAGFSVTTNDLINTTNYVRG